MVAPLGARGSARGTINQGGGLLMPNAARIRAVRRHHPWLGTVHRTIAVVAAVFLIAEIAVVGVSTIRPGRAQAAQAPPGQGFTVTPGDLSFILKQIKIAEHHSAELARLGS